MQLFFFFLVVVPATESCHVLLSADLIGLGLTLCLQSVSCWLLGDSLLGTVVIPVPLDCTWLDCFPPADLSGGEQFSSTQVSKGRVPAAYSAQSDSNMSTLTENLWELVWSEWTRLEVHREKVISNDDSIHLPNDPVLFWHVDLLRCWITIHHVAPAEF